MDTDPQQSGDPSAQPVGTPHADDVIATLLEYQMAEEAMSRRTRDSMRMGTTDLKALRFLIKAQSEQRIVSGRDVADHLGMTSASVTALLDRLTKSGHVQRTPHPTNRRSNMVTATEGSDEEVRQALGAMHGRMIEAAKALSPADAALITGFLESMTAAVDGVHAVAER